jgi:hypothetical protein
VRRQAIGIIAIVLLLAAAALCIWLPDQADEGLTLGALGAFVRVGAVMAALWLAYPDVKRLPAWLLAVIPLLLVILAWKPRWFLYALPIVIALVILKPRARARR